jgi:hypothetical protein
LMALPISFNPFTKITERTSATGSSAISVLHVPTDPRIVIRVPSRGTHTFTVQLPTLSSILF